METGLLLPGFAGFDTVELAARAEDRGYDGVWLPELWGASAPVEAATMAAHTESIGIGTAILNVFSRSPSALAMTAASLDDRSEGRFVLGLGTSTAEAIEGLHGMAFERPVRRAHEAAAIVKRCLDADGRVSYDGEVFTVTDVPGLGADVPVFGAALGSANRRMVGRVCDGWIPHNVPFSFLDEAFDTVRNGAADAGRDPDAVTVAPYVPAAVSDDLAEARAAIRGHVAYYVGSGEGYRRAVGERFPSAAETIASAWGDGERDAARAAVTDEMVGQLGIAATPEEARDALEALVADTVIDRPIVAVPTTAPDLVDATLAAMAPQ